MKINTLKTILVLGLLLRVLVFLFLGPFNNDNHYETIKYIHDYKTLPVSNALFASFHPPLYYILAQLFYCGGSPKMIQLFSLLLSLANLLTIYWLIKELPIIKTEEKKYCLCLASFLPQFIMFGLYISNDSLSFFLGSLLFLQTLRYIRSPDPKQLSLLGICLGLGLLTKGVFIPFILFLSCVIVFINVKNKHKRIFLHLTVFLLISLTLGSYKYAENFVFKKRLFVTNLEMDWVKTQQPTNQGLRSFIDINLVKLCRYPILSEYTQHSYPLLLYGTFWYQYIPESNFQGNLTNFKYLGSCIYILGVIPTIIFLLGLFKITKSLFKSRSLSSPSNDDIYEYFCLFMFLSSLLSLVAFGMKYDVWCCFQSRILFTFFIAIIVILNAGLYEVRNRAVAVYKATGLIWAALFSLFAVYFLIEFLLISKISHHLILFP